MTFFDTLRQLRDGATLSELQDALVTLVDHVGETNKAGKLVLTISVKPAAKSAKSNVLMVSDDIKVIAPKNDRGETVFFALEGGGLSRRDPRQPQLPEMTVVPHRTGTGPDQG